MVRCLSPYQATSLDKGPRGSDSDDPEVIRIDMWLQRSSKRLEQRKRRADTATEQQTGWNNVC